MQKPHNHQKQELSQGVKTPPSMPIKFCIIQTLSNPKII